MPKPENWECLDEVSIVIPKDGIVYLYKLDEVLIRPGQTPEEINLKRIIFTTKPLRLHNTVSATPQNMQLATHWYTLYLETDAPADVGVRQLLFLSGIQEMHRLAAISRPNASVADSTCAAVCSMCELLIQTINSLVQTGVLDVDELPESSVDYLRTLAKYKLERGIADEQHRDTTIVNALVGEDDIASREMVYTLMEALIAACRHRRPGYDLHRIPREDTLSLHTLANQYGAVPIQLLSVFAAPNMEIVDRTKCPQESSVLGISQKDLDASIRVGIDTNDYKKYELTQDLRYVLESFQALTLPYGVFRSNNPEEWHKLQAVAEYLQETRLLDGLIAKSHVTDMTIIYTLTEEVLITLHTEPDKADEKDARTQYSFYFNLPLLSLVSPTLYQ